MFSLLRLVGLGIVAFLSIIVLGISANVNFGLGIATAVLTIISVIPVLAIDFFRKGVFTSWTSVELGLVGLLWVLWLATGADAASLASAGCDAFCEGFFCYGYSASTCSQVRAIAAFGFIGFFILLALWVWTLVIGVRAHNVGDTRIWMTPAYEYSPGPKMYPGGAQMTSTMPNYNPQV
ncbi:hypothetical protein DACRYDRAFT_24499 [Dacryopinax primogenitus]|uniref:MARVEL domain-containing protein n=1 Tax=Dacryopinax primogenitus (strain DJM 731) TaxID=1858805 RepID=M5FY05_DACPD|nr:uncharacterized protein DACRYDRAFT_24499 [Dacryopinax primogenitus]EJT98436.1 hypothetical protein DACRYDRAFT_24499 [Dacryopinax primogenitus]